MVFVALDVHKRYSLASVTDEEGRILIEVRVDHRPGAIKEFLTNVPPGSPVAVETVGNWYWIVTEIEESGHVPRLVNAGLAKKRMGLTNKSDRLDARGLNVLQRNKTLPEVWIPSGKLRDLRELTRTRMYFVHFRTGLKNRFHAGLAKYCLRIDEATDIFAPGCRDELVALLEDLPPQTRFAAREQLDWIDHLAEEVAYFEQRIGEVFEGSAEVELIDTLPGVGLILAVVIWLEVGDVSRFPSAGKLTGYSGTVPRLHQSGERLRHGPTRRDVNHYLKWAYVEAANAISRNRRHWPERHVVRLYERLRKRRGHAKAAVAVARHLGEATWWMLKKGEAYREPVSSREARTRRTPER
jgi:transposase